MSASGARRRWPILGNLVAAISTVLASIAVGALFFAYILSGGHDGIPEGLGQLTAWFALPALAGLAAAIAIRQALRAVDHGEGLLWAVIGDGVAVAALIAWWLYAHALTA
jgi:hypothetical protein